MKLKRRPGKTGRPDSFYAKLALAYTSKLGSGREKEELAEESDELLNASQVAHLVQEARRRKLLTKAPPGRAGES